MGIIKNLTRDGNKWYWTIGSEDYSTTNPMLSGQTVYSFYTNEYGEGIFVNDRYGYPHQLTGTCQFSACQTESGMRKKLNKWFEY